MTLVCCLLRCFTMTPLQQNRRRGDRPVERYGVAGVMRHGRFDRANQSRHAAERAAAQTIKTPSAPVNGQASLPPGPLWTLVAETGR